MLAAETQRETSKAEDGRDRTRSQPSSHPLPTAGSVTQETDESYIVASRQM